MSKMSKAIAVLGVVAGLGVAALPLSSYAVEKTANVTAQAVIGDSIAITVTNPTVTMTGVMANEEAKEASTDVTIQTNSTKGYQIQIADADDDTALKPTGAGTAAGIAAGVPTQGKNAWGFKASSNSSNVTITEEGYRAVGGKAAPKIVGTAAAASATDGDVISLTFGVTVDTTIAADTYQDEVVLTATTK